MNKDDIKAILKQLKSSSSGAMPSSGDVQAAIAAAEKAGLGNLANSLQAVVEKAKERATKKKITKNAITTAVNKDPLERATEYFENKDIKKSEDTATRIEQGEKVTTKDLTHLADHHCSEEARKDRDSILAALEKEMAAIYKNASKHHESKLNEVDAKRVKELRAQHVNLHKRTARDHAVTHHIGDNHTQESRGIAVKKHNKEIKHSLKQNKGMYRSLEELEDHIVDSLERGLEEAAKAYEEGKDTVEDVFENAEKEFTRGLNNIEKSIQDKVGDNIRSDKAVQETKQEVIASFKEGMKKMRKALSSKNKNKKTSKKSIDSPRATPLVSQNNGPQEGHGR